MSVEWEEIGRLCVGWERYVENKRGFRTMLGLCESYSFGCSGMSAVYQGPM